MITMKAKVVSLMLGAGIAFSVVPPTQIKAATGNSAIEKTKTEIFSMSENIDKQIIKIKDLSDRIVEVEIEIETNEEEIVAFNKSIEESVKETDETKADLDEKTEAYGQRLREVYKSGNTSTIGTLLGAESLSDLLLRYKVVRNIAKHDKELVDTIEELKLSLEEKTEELKTSRNELETATEELNDNKTELGRVKDEQQSELSTMKSEQEKLRQLLQEQEVALFSNIEKVFSRESSSEGDVRDALALLRTIQSQISTSKAKAHSKELEKTGETLLSELKEARQEAERVAKEKAEAERVAKEKAEAEKKAQQLTAQESTKPTTTKPTTTTTKPTTTTTKPTTTTTTTTKPTTTNMTFKLTFYTDLPEDNGGWTITATGDKLTYGIVANNVFPLYTKIYLEGYGTMTVKDRGGSSFNTRSRLDVFMPRKSGESNTAYRKRIFAMGVRTVEGRVLD